MRRFLPTIIVVALIAAAGFLAFSYEIPEISVFQVFQDCDQALIEVNQQSEEPLETVLENLQVSVRDVITAGQTYDKKADVSEVFATYEKAYEDVKQYVESVLMPMIKVMEETEFDKVSRQLSHLSPELKTQAEELIQLQQGRITQLNALGDEIQNLVAGLESLETMFYSTTTSDSVQYFQQLNGKFLEILRLHTEYGETVDAYYEAKTGYYEQIANKNMFDYLGK